MVIQVRNASCEQASPGGGNHASHIHSLPCLHALHYAEGPKEDGEDGASATGDT